MGKLIYELDENINNISTHPSIRIHAIKLNMLMLKLIRFILSLLEVEGVKCCSLFINHNGTLMYIGNISKLKLTVLSSVNLLKDLDMELHISVDEVITDKCLILNHKIWRDNMVKVESFQLDHTKVIAPYIRRCCTLEGKNGDKVTKFDLRFVQPNKDSIPTAALHALEHLLAGYIRENLDSVIDLSPMGCRTGFYLIVWGEPHETDIKMALNHALMKVIDSDNVPAANEIQCGNYKDLSLFGAKEYAKYLLNSGFSVNPYGDK